MTDDRRRQEAGGRKQAAVFSVQWIVVSGQWTVTRAAFVRGGLEQS